MTAPAIGSPTREEFRRMAGSWLRLASDFHRQAEEARTTGRKQKALDLFNKHILARIRSRNCARKSGGRRRVDLLNLRGARPRRGGVTP